MVPGTRAVFISVMRDSFDDGTPVSNRVKTVAIPGMGTGVGRVSPKICARRMKAAWNGVVAGQYTFPHAYGLKPKGVINCCTVRKVEIYRFRPAGHSSDPLLYLKDAGIGS